MSIQPVVGQLGKVNKYFISFLTPASKAFALATLNVVFVN